MIYRGKVRGGVVVLQAGVQLPDGLDVTVEPVKAESRQASPAAPASLVRNGVPVFPRQESEIAPGLDIVNELREDTP